MPHVINNYGLATSFTVLPTAAATAVESGSDATAAVTFTVGGSSPTDEVGSAASPTSTHTASGITTGTVIGIAAGVGGLVILGLAFGITLCCVMKSRRKKSSFNNFNNTPAPIATGGPNYDEDSTKIAVASKVDSAPYQPGFAQQHQGWQPQTPQQAQWTNAPPAYQAPPGNLQPYQVPPTNNYGGSIAEMQSPAVAPQQQHPYPQMAELQSPAVQQQQPQQRTNWSAPGAAYEMG